MLRICIAVSALVACTEPAPRNEGDDVPESVPPTPFAVVDVFDVRGRTGPFEFAASAGVLRNDTLVGATLDAYGPWLGTEQPVLGSPIETSGGGSIAINSDGSFVYWPPATRPATGTDQFRYRLAVGVFFATATVTMLVGCGSETCNGCCTEQGECSAGTAVDACGNNGHQCRSCGALADCSEGVCTNTALLEDGRVDDSHLLVRQPVDVSTVRADIIRYLWGTSGIPTTLPYVVEPVTTFPIPTVADVVKRVARMRINIRCSLRVNAYVYQPLASNGRTVLWHQGHASDLGGLGGAATVRALLISGYTVLAVWMPGFGESTPRQVHDVLLPACVLSKGNPIGILLEPAIAMLNWAELYGLAADVSMVGLSGGGWSTVLLTAIDPRIRLSVPVAGSLPLYARGVVDRGDLEQYENGLYAIAGYLDLYSLGAAGTSRAQLQIFNEFDNCCFAGRKFEEFAPRVSATLSNLSTGGDWSVALDSTHYEHRVSSYALDELIMPFLDAHPAVAP